MVGFYRLRWGPLAGSSRYHPTYLFSNVCFLQLMGHLTIFLTANPTPTLVSHLDASKPICNTMYDHLQQCLLELACYSKL